MTDASKNTRSFGHVHGLLDGSLSLWHMLSIECRSHHATLRLIVPAIMVPRNWDENLRVRRDNDQIIEGVFRWITWKGAKIRLKSV